MRSYRIGMAAERSGLSQAVIRAWERRYGVLEPARTPGGYRVYSEKDIALLQRLRQLTEEGVAIREAAALVPRLRREIAAGQGAGNGAAIGRWRDEMVAGAARLDQDAVERARGAGRAARPPLQVYDELVVRLEREGDPRGTPERAQQQLAIQVIRARLANLLRGSRGRSRGHVVCACLPDEEHDLGLLGAGLRFRHAGFRVTFLGARTPIEHLAHVTRRLRPDLVALGCVNDPGAAALRRTLAALVRALPARTRCIIGGRTAVRRAAICERAGLTVVDDDTAWRQVPGMA
jgi:DNA-binding transcriptional MerR regulator